MYRRWTRTVSISRPDLMAASIKQPAAMVLGYALRRRCPTFASTAENLSMAGPIHRPLGGYWRLYSAFGSTL
jgi:hypothetical protein